MDTAVALIPLSFAAWSDIKSREIPDAIILLLLVCAVVSVARGALTIAASLAGCLVLGSIALVCAVLMENGTAIGGGDVKLCAAIGAVLGSVNGGLTIVLALLLLVVYALLEKERSLPFAPFMLFSYIMLNWS